ncbi:MAG: TetR/AcrR family transcriptional regulator [Gammaproteobacteria bacterium]|nr:MAG: TetR/AcrR family transcriptional regulator [Gammaproteobacteria bacterium]
MPRIAAATIEEHVRQQTERITAAARLLFAQNGFHATDLGDIARAVGLARNSLYRYYANKDELLLACIEEDMAPYLQRLQLLAEEYPDPVERIMAWLGLQFELATGPAHATMELIAEVRESSRELKKQVAHLHAAPNIFLQSALQELRGEKSAGAPVAIQAAMIGGMVLAATGHALQLDTTAQDLVRSELESAVRAIVSTVSAG